MGSRRNRPLVLGTLWPAPNSQRLVTVRTQSPQLMRVKNIPSILMDRVVGTGEYGGNTTEAIRERSLLVSHWNDEVEIGL